MDKQYPAAIKGSSALSTTSPPLDEVTVQSLTETEQSSSCDIFSDISSVDSSSDVEKLVSSDELKDRQRRSIFADYWTRKCRIGLQRQSIPSTSGVTDDDTKASDNTYERALQDYEETRPERGTVFRSNMSLPEMARAARPKPVSRKPCSDSILETRAPSCLRPRSQRNAVGALSVRFSESVQVVEFAPPTATWAPKGWSDYFF